MFLPKNKNVGKGGMLTETVIYIQNNNNNKLNLILYNLQTTRINK